MISKIVILGAGKSGVGAAILGKKIGYDVFVSEKKESIFYENLMQWMSKAGNAPVHLWTDSEKVYLQFKKTHSNAINITGPILHIDRTSEISSEKKARAFKRVIIEWLLVSRCSRISQQTGFINTALFNAQAGAKVFRHYFG